MGHTRQTNLESRDSVIMRKPSVVSDCETTVLHHHQPGHDAERLWVDKLQPRLEQLRHTLTQRPEELVSHHSGVNLAAGSFRVCMLSDEYLVDASTYVVTDSDGGPIDSFRQSLVLTYLATADGIPPAGRWISFRELPDGGFYHRAFQGYAADRLSAHWRLDLDGFTDACRGLGGAPIEHGGAGFAFRVLPRVEIAAVYWAGDEELPSKASILFDATAHHYMVVDGLAILGSRLVDRLLAAG